MPVAGLEKVRAALSVSAQRELLTRLKELAFLGVPALPAKKQVREAIERAWFEDQAVRITYVDKDFVQTTRDVRVRAVVMDRHETRLDTEDIVTGERRPYRLDRITKADNVEPVAQ